MRHPRTKYPVLRTLNLVPRAKLMKGSPKIEIPDHETIKQMNRRIALYLTTLTILAATRASTAYSATSHPDGELTVEVVDSVTGQPIAARMHLYAGRSTGPATTAKRPVKLNMPGSAEFGGHFYIDGKATLPLRIGAYNFELEAGPEYLTQNGQFEIERHADDSKRIEMKRVTDLAKEGWYGGDLDIRRKKTDLPLILRAEALHLAPPSELPTKDAKESKDVPPKFELDGHLIARTPYAWDLPVWLASGKLGAIELINPHSLRNGVVDNEKDGRPRDKSFFPGPRGNGRWAETVYYHVLNCGFRIPPVAGSGSGFNDSPVGTNRVYVFCGNEFSEKAWWEGLKAGRVFVTNGPLLRPMVEGHPPGYTFPIDSSGSLTLEIGLNLATSVPVEYLQIIKNGTVEAEVRLAEFKNRKGRLPPIHFDDSGWFLVRAVTSNPKTLQFASSGPYYVEKAGHPRISRASVNFFIDWIDMHIGSLASGNSADVAKNEPTLAALKSAQKFFVNLLSKANAD